MTTFGGATVPPIFSGSDSASGGGQDIIFLLGVGAVENYDQSIATDGTPTDKPSGIEPGDTMFVWQNLSDSAGTPVQPWTTLTGILNANQGRIRFRIADGTVDDNFNFPAGEFTNGTTVMAVFRTTPGFYLAHSASNVQLQETDTDWQILELVEGVLTDTLVFALMSRSASANLGAAFTVSDNIDIANIIQASGDNHGGANHALWRFWGYEFEATPRAHSAGDLTYGPNQNAAVKTRYARFSITVIP